MSRRLSYRGRSRVAGFGGNMLWQLVGVAAGVIGYAAEAGGFELEMRRAALRRRYQRDDGVDGLRAHQGKKKPEG